jgi:hypothetical protein
LEKEINTIANEINSLVIQIYGGRDNVNKVRDEHNKKAEF